MLPAHPGANGTRTAKGRHVAWLPVSAPSLVVLCLVAPCIGSFVGVLVRRLPAGRPVALARSECESCGATLSARDLVPLLSFVVLRGRCRHCGAPIAPFHPAVELAALAVAVSAAGVFEEPATLWASCALGWTLLALGLLDARHFWLPDVLTLPLLLLGLLVTVLLDPAAAPDHAAAAALGYAGFRLVALGYRRLRGRDGLGAGDAKLLAALGAWGGTAFLAPTVLAAALLGLGVAGVLAVVRPGGMPVRLATMRLPLGTLLAAAFWPLWLWAGSGTP